MNLAQLAAHLEALPDPIDTTALLCVELAARQRRLREEARVARLGQHADE